MKKHLIAAAVAAAVAVPAMAQVSISGNMNASVASNNNGAGVKRTSVENNLITTSQLTISGSEDLGGGLRATFALEGGLGADDGSLGGSRILRAQDGTLTTQTTGATYTSSNVPFNRQANIGISGGFGRVVIGRQQTAVNAYKDVNAGVKAFDNATSAAVGRPANAVGYHSPAFNGITAQVVYSTGAEFEGTTNDTKSNNRAVAYGLQYAQGPLTLRVAASELGKKASDVVNVALTTTGTTEDSDTFFGAEYDMGVVRIGVAQHSFDAKTISTGAKTETEVRMLTAVAPLGAGLSLHAVWHDTDVKNSTADAQMWGVAVKKDLSKRTSLVGLYRSGDNEGTSAKYGGAAGAKAKLFAVGVSHSF